MGRKPCGPAFVIGVGMTKFIKPRGLVDYPELGFEASVKALLDADINFDDVEQAIACYCFGDSTCGQRVIYQLGMTQIPVYNVNNNCGSGSTGLSMARTLVGYGVADCVLVVGFEKMKSGGLRGNWSDRSSPVEVNHEVMKQTRGFTDAPPPAQMFGNAGREYMEKYAMQNARRRIGLADDCCCVDTELRPRILQKSLVSIMNTPNVTLTPSSKTNTH
jgi:sterol carrier protein 2